MGIYLIVRPVGKVSVGVVSTDKYIICGQQNQSHKLYTLTCMGRVINMKSYLRLCSVKKKGFGSIINSSSQISESAVELSM